jgi:hypothetical protein
MQASFIKAMDVGEVYTQEEWDEFKKNDERPLALSTQKLLEARGIEL